MSPINFQAFTGLITHMEYYPFYPTDEETGCHKFITVQNETGMIVNFIAGPNTYFVNHEMVSVGDQITGYLDGDVPVILIYPPQYYALIIVKESPSTHVKVDYFDDDLVSGDGNLKLHVNPDTPILLTNGQAFNQNPAQRNLIVTYTHTSKSIPALTTPEEIIVYCR